MLSYLWTFYYDEEENRYQIVHVRTDLNLSAERYECRLEYGEMTDSQYFNLQEIKDNVFRIRDQEDNYLVLDGILQTDDYAERDTSQEFMLRKVKMEDIPAFQGTGYVWTQDAKRAVDLTNASRKN